MKAFNTNAMTLIGSLMTIVFVALIVMMPIALILVGIDNKRH